MPDGFDCSSIAFVLLTLVTIWLFNKASASSRVILIIVIWMIIVGTLGLLGFYQNTQVQPPRFLLLIAPPFLLILGCLADSKGRHFMDRLDLKWLTILHVIRIPVEIILFDIANAGLIPKSMTYEGFNFDILSGLSAPLMYYAFFVKKCIKRPIMLIWNIVCLLLLINVVAIGILSAPTPFQQWAFDQPNIGVTYFPFVWLPAVVVPIVIFDHVASIRQLLFKEHIE